MGLCISIANKMRVPPGVERDDLVGAAMLALVREAPRFDPSRGVPEGAWVSALVRNRMVDEVRRLKGTGAARSVRAGESLDAPRGDDADVTLVGMIAAPAEVDAEMVEERLAWLTDKQRGAVLGDRPADVNAGAWYARRHSAKKRILSGPAHDRTAPPLTAFGAMVQDEMRRRGLGYREAGAEIGVNVRWLHQVVKRNRTLMSIPNFVKLIDWLGIDIHTAAEAMQQ